MHGPAHIKPYQHTSTIFKERRNDETWLRKVCLEILRAVLLARRAVSRSRPNMQTLNMYWVTMFLKHLTSLQELSKLVEVCGC